MGAFSVAAIAGVPFGSKLSLLYAFMAMGIAIFSTFLIVPHLAAWLQFNLGVPREAMSFYYVVGGVASLIVLQLGGRLIDKLGALRVTLAIAVLVIFLLWDGFMHAPWLPPLIIFTLFMSLTATRTIAATAVNTQVHNPASARLCRVSVSMCSVEWRRWYRQ